MQCAASLGSHPLADTAALPGLALPPAGSCPSCWRRPLRSAATCVFLFATRCAACAPRTGRCWHRRGRRWATPTPVQRQTTTAVLAGRRRRRTARCPRATRPRRPVGKQQKQLLLDRAGRACLPAAALGWPQKACGGCTFGRGVAHGVGSRAARTRAARQQPTPGPPPHPPSSLPRAGIWRSSGPWPRTGCRCCSTRLWPRRRCSAPRCRPPSRPTPPAATPPPPPSSSAPPSPSCCV